jgi:hypothetical protein
MGQRGGSVEVRLSVAAGAADRLGRAFGFDPAAPGSADLIRAIAASALDEYVGYFSGERTPATLRDLREQRLARLLSHRVAGVLNETRVASLFALTTGQARSLLAGTRARYRSEVEAGLQAEAHELLTGPGRTGRNDDDEVWFRASPSFVAVMRDLLASAETTYPPIRASSLTTHTYLTHPTTLAYLCEQLGVAARDVEALR